MKEATSIHESRGTSLTLPLSVIIPTQVIRPMAIPSLIEVRGIKNKVIIAGPAWLKLSNLTLRISLHIRSPINIRAGEVAAAGIMRKIGFSSSEVKKADQQ